MKATVAVTRKLRAGADEAWAAIESVGGLDVWFPIMRTCTVEGASVGARRYITLDAGLGEMLDIVRSIDPVARRLRYERVESPFPVSSFVGTVEVFASFDGFAVIAWSVELDLEPDVLDGVTEVIEQALGDGVAGMDADLSPL